MITTPLHPLAGKGASCLLHGWIEQYKQQQAAGRRQRGAPSLCRAGTAGLLQPQANFELPASALSSPASNGSPQQPLGAQHHALYDGLLKNISTGPKTVEGETAACYDFPFTLHQLSFLCAYAAKGTFQDASEAMGSTKQAVNYNVLKLEQSLGIALQGTHGKVVTPAGKLFLRYAERMCSLCKEAMAAVRDLQELRAGSMYVAASQTTGVYLMPGVIERYKQHHPAITVHLQVEDTRRCCRAVLGGEVDLAVVGGEIPLELQHTLQAVPYLEDEVVVAVGRDHPKAKQGELDAKELAEMAFVSLHRSSTVKGIHTALEQAGIDWKSLQVVMEVNSVEAIKSVVETSGGAAFLSAMAIKKEVELGRLFPLRIRGVPLKRVLNFITDPARYCTKAVRAFVREMFGLSTKTASQGCILPFALNAGVPLSSGSYPELAGRGPRFSDYSQPTPERLVTVSKKEAVAALKEEQASNGPSRANEVELVPFTLNHAVAFRTLARSGTMMGAAAALSMSQPIFKKTIQGLEQSVGAQLMVKSTRGKGVAKSATWLTEAGQALLPYMERLVATATEATRALADLNEAKTGCVALAASQTVGTYIMPRLLADFRVHNPQVSATLKVGTSRDACELVVAGKVDVAMIGGEVPPELVPELQVTPYTEDELVLVVPPGHRLVSGGSVGPVEVKALYNEPLVSLPVGSTVQQVQEAVLARHGIAWSSLLIDMEFNSVEAIKNAVQHGLGAAFLSSAAVKQELELGLLKRVHIRDVRLLRPLSLVVSPLRSHSSVAHKFMTEVFDLGRAGIAVPCGSSTCCKGSDSSKSKEKRPSRPWGSAELASTPHMDEELCEEEEIQVRNRPGAPGSDSKFPYLLGGLRRVRKPKSSNGAEPG